MRRYLIKFKPLNSYFFGGEQTFGDGENINYFAKSNVFPQQTTILGTLRKEILIQKGKFKENFIDYSESDKKEMSKLIGRGSFIIRNPFDFGVIKSISPVFISDSDDKYFINIPKDFKLTFTKNNSLKSYINKEKSFIPHIPDFNPKEGLSTDFISFDKNVRKKFEEIFKEQIKIGIAKDRKEDDKEKLFKQLRYNMIDNYTFAVIVDFEDEFELNNSVVYMGADNSAFKMIIIPFTKSFNDIFKTFKTKEKVILLSDTFIDEDIYCHCEFAVTETINFRNLKFFINNYKFEKNKTKSNKYTFIKSGSVFFTKEKEKISTVINKHESLKKIGYNHFI